MKIKETNENTLQPYWPNGHRPSLYFSAAVVIDETVKIPSMFFVGNNQNFIIGGDHYEEPG